MVWYIVFSKSGCHTVFQSLPRPRQEVESMFSPLRGHRLLTFCASAASVKWENSARIVFTMKWEHTCKACRQSLEMLDVIIMGHKLGTQLSELDWQPK